ncbi:MAG: nucleotidyl transferase AbiEii/AbiGii toxin family protein [Bacteroidales bacterium]|jgi:predicted nucleotidyltransferase component of viral defense system|nr:nucleotidyl transferase AbiEii/AbiGii toxin family protein [Bacteroidales bacterium]
MINKIEINRLAIEKKVRPSIIDKDWVLGHFIDAIFSIPECRQNLIFKGGTCLKKCRLPDYRFSEDLDFTAVNADFLLSMPLLEKIVALVTKRTEMPLHIYSLEELYFNNKLTGYATQIKYWGAEHGKNQQPPEPLRWLTSIKIEVILYEKMRFAPEKAAVIHNYSDKLTDNAQNIPIYSITETLAEKLRALIQRSYTAPRDYYDIWYLSNNIANIDWKEVVEAFYEKSAYKNLHFESIGQFINPQNDKILRTAWRNSLSHQVEQKKLPEYETVRSDLLELFKKIL